MSEKTLGKIAAINIAIFLLVFLYYAFHVLNGSVTTSITSWSIFTLTSWINAFSYYYATHSRKVISAIYFTSAVMCTLVMLASVFVGDITALKALDWAILGLSVVALAVGRYQNSIGKNGALYTQVIIVGVVGLGFFPLWLGQAQEVLHESAFVWGLWSLSLAVQVFLATHEHEIACSEGKWDGAWIIVFGPISYFWLHLVVTVLCFV